jgi:type I restriction enzyme S subunit
VEVRPGYKQTRVGVIPADWDAKSLGEVGDALIGLTYKPSDVREYGTLVLRASNIQDDGLAFDDNVFVNCAVPERIMVCPGDVLICVRNGSRELIGKTAYLDERARGMTFGAFMAVHRGRAGKLVSYLFQSEIVKRQIREHLGATINQITNKSLNSFRIPLPRTEDEQRAITTALSDVDALLGALDRLIAKKRDLKQAAMQQLLTAQTRLPGFSGEWEVKRLGDHLEFLKHGVNSRAELTAEGQVKYLHYGDVHGSQGLLLNPNIAPMPHLPVRKAERLDRLADGDLVFADASEDLEGVGKSVELHGVARAEVVSGLHTIAVRFDKQVLADGFKAYLQFMPVFRQHLRRLAAGTKVYATNRAHVASVEMKLPTAEEQTAIVTVLSKMDAEIEAIEARRVKTRDLKQAMMQELLTGRTRLVRPEDEGAAAC